MSYTYANLARSTVRETRAPGEPTLLVAPGDGHLFGEPTPEAPMRAVAYKGKQLLSIFHILEREGDGLTLGEPVAGYGDVEIPRGAVVANVLLANDLEDLWRAIEEVEVIEGPPGPEGPQGPPGIGMPGRDGEPGAPGSVWREGSGPPSNDLGIDGDFYLDSLTGGAYRRESGAYLLFANLTGPPGERGPKGEPGVGKDGKDGDPGPPGVGSFGLEMPAGFVVSNSPLTSSGTIHVATDLVGLVKASSGEFVAAVAEEDYATPAQVAAKAEDSEVVKLAGAQTLVGVKTLPAPIFSCGFSIQNAVGSEVSGFDGEGRGFVEKFIFRFVDGFLRLGPNQSGQGALAAFEGKLRSFVVKVRSNPASGGFGLQIRRNGAAIFPAPVVVAADFSGVKIFEDFADDVVEIGDEFTIDVDHAGQGVAGVVAVLSALVRNR